MCSRASAVHEGAPPRPSAGDTRGFVSRPLCASRCLASAATPGWAGQRDRPPAPASTGHQAATPARHSRGALGPTGGRQEPRRAPGAASGPEGQTCAIHELGKSRDVLGGGGPQGGAGGRAGCSPDRPLARRLGRRQDVLRACGSQRFTRRAPTVRLRRKGEPPGRSDLGWRTSASPAPEGRCACSVGGKNQREATLSKTSPRLHGGPSRLTAPPTGLWCAKRGAATGSERLWGPGTAPPGGGGGDQTAT